MIAYNPAPQNYTCVVLAGYVKPVTAKQALAATQFLERTLGDLHNSFHGVVEARFSQPHADDSRIPYCYCP